MSLPLPEPEHARRWIDDAIDAFELDLDGLTVLTEAASGPFVVTPLLAARAGARQVLAMTAASHHATVDEVVELTGSYAARLGVARRLTVLTEREDPRIDEAEVVTNLGFVRPLDRPLLSRLGRHAAVALMCEPWEVRAGDVDLRACRTLGIPALGTNEDDERLRMFDYLPDIAANLLRELDLDVPSSRLVLISGGRFARALARGLSAMGAEILTFAPGEATTAPAFDAAIHAADALVVADYPGSGPILGPEAPVSAGHLRSLNRELVLAHIAGDVALDDLAGSGLQYAPTRIAPAGRMSVTAGELGARPVTRLHCAGLRVGAALSRARQRGLGARDAEIDVLGRLPLALGSPATEEATA